MNYGSSQHPTCKQHWSSGWLHKYKLNSMRCGRPFILNVMLKRPQWPNNGKPGTRPRITFCQLALCHCIAGSGYLQNDYTLGGQSEASLPIINIRPKTTGADFAEPFPCLQDSECINSYMPTERSCRPSVRQGFIHFLAVNLHLQVTSSGSVTTLDCLVSNRFLQSLIWIELSSNKLQTWQMGWNARLESGMPMFKSQFGHGTSLGEHGPVALFQPSFPHSLTVVRMKWRRREENDFVSCAGSSRGRKVEESSGGEMVNHRVQRKS